MENKILFLTYQNQYRNSNTKMSCNKNKNLKCLRHLNSANQYMKKSIDF